MDEILMHPFFAELDMSKLLQKRIVAPFIPVIAGHQDLRNFDSEIVGEGLAESILPALSIEAIN